MCVCFPLKKISTLPIDCVKRTVGKVCAGTGKLLGPVIAQGEADYYLPHHAICRHDFASKKKPDVARAFVVLRPWSIAVYKTPAHMKHNAIRVIETHDILMVNKRTLPGEPPYIEIMTMNMEFMNLFVARNPETGEDLDTVMSIDTHELDLWKALFRMAMEFQPNYLIADQGANFKAEMSELAIQVRQNEPSRHNSTTGFSMVLGLGLSPVWAT